MRGLLLAVGVLVLLEACAASSVRRSEISDEELLSGRALDSNFAVSAPVISIDDAFALDDEMHAFVRQISEVGDSSTRVVRLLAAMKQRGLFSLEYNEAVTQTVSGTFHERRGNCLSFTMLFIALAREAGLHARYQLVDVPPQWNLDADLVVIANHVNAVIDSRTDKDLVVDFNKANFRGDLRRKDRRRVRRVALLYEPRRGGDAAARLPDRASRCFARPCTRAPMSRSPWVNLGVLYGRQGLRVRRSLYLRALRSLRKNARRSRISPAFTTRSATLGAPPSTTSACAATRTSILTITTRARRRRIAKAVRGHLAELRRRSVSATTRARSTRCRGRRSRPRSRGRRREELRARHREPAHGVGHAVGGHAELRAGSSFASLIHYR